MEPFAGCSNVLSFYIEKFIVSLSNKSFKQTNYVVVLYFDHTKYANNVVEDIRNFIQSEFSGFAGFVGGHKIVKTDSIFEAVIYSDPSLEEENKQILKKYDATNYDFYKL